MEIYICEECINKYYEDTESGFQQCIDGQEALCEICHKVNKLFYRYFAEEEVLDMVKTIRLQNEQIKALELQSSKRKCF